MRPPLSPRSPRVRVHDARTAAADYTGDGRVDVEDVKLFEQMYGLSGELSKRMRSMG